MRLETEEYVPWVETIAMMTFIHPITETIFSESPRYNAEPSGETTIQVYEVSVNSWYITYLSHQTVTYGEYGEGSSSCVPPVVA